MLAAIAIAQERDALPYFHGACDEEDAEDRLRTRGDAGLDLTMTFIERRYYLVREGITDRFVSLSVYGQPRHHPACPSSPPSWTCATCFWGELLLACFPKTQPRRHSSTHPPIYPPFYLPTHPFTHPRPRTPRTSRLFEGKYVHHTLMYGANHKWKEHGKGKTPPLVCTVCCVLCVLCAALCAVWKEHGKGKTPPLVLAISRARSASVPPSIRRLRRSPWRPRRVGC